MKDGSWCMEGRVAAVALCALLGVCGLAAADAVWGEQFTLLQPDGVPLDVRIWGDEYYGVTETLDGYTLVRDSRTLSLCYARLSADGNDLVSTGVRPDEGDAAALGLTPHVRIRPEAADAKARAARVRFDQEAQAAMGGLRASRGPSTGAVAGITLIVEFPDVPGTIAPSAVSSYCNQVGYTGYGNNGSVRDYFYDVSEGLLTYTNFVPSAYYTAAHPRSYYTDPSVSYGWRARQLIVEALTALDNAGFDFSLYDADGDGVVDALNCFYAGPRVNNWAEGLWPHASSVYFVADGVRTGPYQITDMGNSLRLSTFCHENGHMLMGWPDLYDYGHDSSGVGRFCIMCYGTSDTNPQEPCAYLKYIAGWANVTVLDEPQANVSVPVTGNTMYRFLHPTKYNEYYLIENRQKSGRDAGLPGQGLAIWHIDTLGSNNNQQMTPELHYEVTLVQADGRWDLENGANYGDATDLWAAPTYTECTPETSPNTNWWDGTASGLVVTGISASGPVMTFTFGDGEDCNENGVPDFVDIANGTSADCNGNLVPDECDIADGTSDDCNGNDIPDECDIATGTSDDCNGNDVPDECDIAQGLSSDCDGNLVPDECQPDCNDSGTADVCEILAGLVTDANGNGVPDECEIAPKFEAGFTTANHVPKTVSLQNTYTNPVVVCTGQYFYNGKRMTPRVSNVTAGSFDLRLVDPTNASQTYSIQEVVCYWVMEQGVSELNGVKMEAWKYTSTVTDGNGDWTGEARRYGQQYDNPVVLGQVMSANDAWSVFWTQGSRKTSAPSPTALRTGKHTGNTGLDRADETIGVIVFESVTGTGLGGVPFEAAVGPATVQGVLHGTPPHTAYALQTPMAAPQFVAIASPAGLQGDTGFWVQRHGQAGSGGSTYLLLSLDDDLDRTHPTGERVAYALLKSALVWPRVPDFDGDGDVDLKDFGVFQACFGQAAAGICLNADLTGDGLIDEADVPLFVNQMQGP